jgi:hypothetical protein
MVIMATVADVQLIVANVPTGLDAPGSISAPGVKVGDMIWKTSFPQSMIETYMEPIITVDDEIQQITEVALSTAGPFQFYLFRPTAVS